MAMNGPAALSGALMARKGAAVPAGYTPVRPQAPQTLRQAKQYPGNSRSEPAPIKLVTDRVSPPPEVRRARVSVRLDRDRHFKLKLTAAHLDRSLQDVLIDALDSYLEQIGPEVLRNDCACLRARNAVQDGTGRAD